MTWLILVVAGLLEIVWATAMKFSAGFTKFTPTSIMLVAMVGSFWLLAIAMRSLSLGTAYMVWTGIGAIGSFVVGLTMMGEPVTALRMAAATLILAGIVLMKLAS